jgi:chromosome segregation ATPase
MTPSSEILVNPKQPALIVTYGRTDQKYRPLQRDLVMIGQGRSCDIGLASPEVADAHCVLFRTADGWLLRDCGSRVGTRLNGTPVRECAVADGDVLQIGTFTFRFHLPASGHVTATRERHLEQSRRHLARLALSLRRRFRGERPALGACQADVDRQMSFLRGQLRQYEARRRQLQQAERELADGRECLATAEAALRDRSQQAERDLAQRRRAVEAELRRRQEEWEARRREPERLPPAAAAGPGADPEAVYHLDLRRRELACYARHLQRTRQRYEQERRSLEAELEELRAEDLRLRHLLAQRESPGKSAPAAEETARLTRQVEELQAQLGEARRQAEEKESQVQQLLRNRTVVDPRPQGMDVETYEAELAEFRRQLQADRRGLNEEIRLLRQRTVALDEAARAIEQQLTQERERLARERQELNRLRGGAHPPAGQAAGEPLAVVSRFRETMAALSGQSAGPSRPEGGAKGGSNGRGYRVRGPRRGDSGSVRR